MRNHNIHFGIVGIFLFLFFLLLYLVITQKSNSFDEKIYQKIATKITPKNTIIMKLITFFGSTVGIICGIGISYFFLKDNYNFFFMIGSMIIEVILNNVMKLLVGRIRPNINPLVKETGHSFPSGHTMASTAFYSFVMYFVWKSSLTMIIQIIITILCISIILLILMSRVYLGVHYTSDVLAGLCFSIAYVALMTYFYPTIYSWMMSIM